MSNWDPETERRIGEALAASRPPIVIVDHHPWEAPNFRPCFTGNALDWRRMRRRFLGFVALLLAVEIVRQASKLSGWDRLGLALVALVILFVTVLTDRRPE